MSASPRFRSAADAEAYLLSFIDYERTGRYLRNTETHDLARFRERLVAGGWRPGSVPSIHVTGTNGKGSTAVLLERALRAGGLRTGLFTSPHLRDIRERIRIDGRPMEARRFREGVEHLGSLFRAEPGAGFRTVFEHLTALAFLAFQEAKVDVMVVEVGLGGRLDATNVLPPGDAVFTPVSLDHRHLLGNTPGAIAADKAHILKPGGRGWTAPQPADAFRALERRARETGAPLTPVSDAVSVATIRRDRRGTTFAVAGRDDYGRIRTGLLGGHQAHNVAAAVAVAEAVLGPRRRQLGVTGLAGVSVPGRLQRLVRGGRVWILDGGHNPAAGKAVAAALGEHFGQTRFPAVVGMAGDKDHAGYLGAIAPVVDRLVLTRADNPRAADPDLLRRAAPRDLPSTVAPGIASALESASGDGGPVLVLGSFLVVGAALEALSRRR